MNKRERGLLGRRVRVPRRAGTWAITSVDRDGSLNLRRDQWIKSSWPYLRSVPRAGVRFIRRNYEERP